MESIGFEPKECITKGKDIINLLSNRGAIEILCSFCCSTKKIRFTEIHKLLNYISTKTLSSRLKELTKIGLLERKVYNEIPPKVEYGLTDKGQTLIEAIMPMLKWIMDESSPKNKSKKREPPMVFTEKDFKGWLI